MRARNNIILCIVSVMIHGTAWSEELYVDFRRAGFDNTTLKLVGPSAHELVSPTDRGLLIRIPPKEGIVGPIGLAPRKMLHGDFEIIAEFELLKYDRPRDGSGVGVGLVVEFTTAGIDPITVGRLATPGQGDGFSSADLPFGEGNARPVAKRVPARSRTGKLKLVRAASTVRAYYSDGGDAFKLLREFEVGDADARIVRLGAETGSSSYRVEALLKSLTVTAEALVAPAERPAPSTAGIDPVILAVAAFDIIAVGFLGWKLWLTRASKPRGKKVAR